MTNYRMRSGSVFLILFILTSLFPASAQEKQKQANPAQLKYTKWTPEFDVPDPVAISFDLKGRAYVTQTQRRKANDLDIRNNTDWITDDLSFQSVDDKIAFYQKQFTPENSEANKHRVEDFNGDGVHDIQDLTALSERIHLIEDTDGDGLADSTKVFAEDLDHLIGGVAGGVLFHDGSLYTCPVPELVRFRDTDGDDQADEKDVLVTGFGIHLAYAGHDMHGLMVGPDGRIYWSVGDKGVRVKTPDGRDYKYPNQGALMRCELDGSNFEVYAHGLRNIQEAGFDQYGNFFGVDNDADYEGEKERFVYIEQYLDAGWRANWQYLKGDYNPWDDDKMHIPYHDGQPLWFTPPLKNYENGPAGFKINPGTALSPEYADYAFLTSAPNGQQWAFQIKPKGDSFAMVNDHKISEGIPLVGLAFAPDGGLYGVDWGGGYPLNEKGAVWKIDVAKENQHPLREETQNLIAADFSEKKIEELQSRLAHADQRVRLKAQFELARRDDGLQAFEELLQKDGNEIATIHAIWGLGQLLRGGEQKAESSLAKLLHHSEPEIRAQALKTLTDQSGTQLGLNVVAAPSGKAHPLSLKILPLLEDSSQRVRLQALLGLARLGDTESSGSIIELLAEKENSMGLIYLRHAGATALAGCSPTEELARLAGSDSEFLRACAVTALRRRADKAVSAFLRDKNPVIAADAARAIHDDWMIPAAMPALAASLGISPENEAFTRRAISANFRLGTPEAADRVAAFVAEGKAGEPLLEAGLEALENWTNPGDRDLVVGRYRPLEDRDPEVLSIALSAHLDKLLVSPFAVVQSTSMGLARKANLPISNETLEFVLKNSGADETLRAQALRSLVSQEAPNVIDLASNYLEDESKAVNRAALEALTTLDPDAAAPLVEKRINESPDTPTRQHAVSLLPDLHANEIMGTLVTKLAAGEVKPGIALDIFTAAKSPAFGDDRAIAEPIEKIETAWNAAMATDPLAPFEYTLEGGDAARGRALFLNHEAAQCIRCHKLKKGKGSDVGPNLEFVAKKNDRRYLLESLVAPYTTVAKGYGTISITLKDGTTVAGQFRGEENGVLTIRDPEKVETKIQEEDIKDRSPVISTMPPMGFILKKDEMRDVIEFLATLK